MGLTPSLLELLDSAALRATDEWKYMGPAETGAMFIAEEDSSDVKSLAVEMVRIMTAARAGDGNVVPTSWFHGCAGLADLALRRHEGFEPG